MEDYQLGRLLVYSVNTCSTSANADTVMYKHKFCNITQPLTSKEQVTSLFQRVLMDKLLLRQRMKKHLSPMNLCVMRIQACWDVTLCCPMNKLPVFPMLYAPQSQNYLPARMM